jgi:lipopolysaccharide transport system ATP-binding protein
MTIIVHNLSKKYKIDTLHPSVGGGIRDLYQRFLRRLKSPFSPPVSKKTFTAIDEVSFTIHPGEKVAFLGENGAGKSTLLRILAGVTRPSSGEAKIIGRMASLLEVGAGFHPDLTGRENLYLNGIILGLTRKEIDKLLDSIVSFASVGPFMETPVKHFSSGMRARLAFSIAIHSEPDILILDEALSVGDQYFQEQCQEKVAALAARGATLIFVAHQIEPLLKLCNRGLYLENGKLTLDAPIEKAVSHYLKITSQPHLFQIKPQANSLGLNRVR